MLSGQRQSAIFQLHINLRLHSNTRRCLKTAEDSRTTGSDKHGPVRLTSRELRKLFNSTVYKILRNGQLQQTDVKYFLQAVFEDVSIFGVVANEEKRL